MACPDDLGHEAEKKLHDDTLYFYRSGIENVDVSGTEPLKYSKILPYLKTLKSLFKKITVLDPCNRLEDEKFTKGLVDTGLDVLVIPIYGSCPEVHDACVRNPGAFRQLTSGIKNFLKHKRPSQVADLTTVTLKQNKSDIVNLVKYLKKEFGVSVITINPPMAIEVVKPYYDYFCVYFKDIHDILLQLTKVKDFKYMIKFIVPCLFSEQELLQLKSTDAFSFYNLFYTYNLPEGEFYKKHGEIVRRYREQVYHSKCDKCHLKKSNICSGILRMHYAHNKDYSFQPVSQELYEKIKGMLDYQKFNPK